MKQGRPKRPRLFLRNRRSETEALSPLLSALRSEAPPEGLLQSIEREVEGVPADRRRGAAARVGQVTISIAAACMGVAAIILAGPQADVTDLRDPTGRAVAQIRQEDGDAFVKLLSGRVDPNADKSWHLWGLPSTAGVAVHLGLLADSELAIANPEAYAGFAISMEDRGFSGDRPVGPVIPLVAEN